QFDHDCFMAVKLLLSVDGNQEILFQMLTAGVESKIEILVYQFLIALQVIFLNAIDFGVVNVKILASTEDSAGIRLCELNADFLVFADPDLAALGGRIFYDFGVFDSLNVGSKAVKILRGMIHQGEDGVRRPFLRALWLGRNCRNANHRQGCAKYKKFS